MPETGDITVPTYETVCDFAEKIIQPDGTHPARGVVNVFGKTLSISEELYNEVLQGKYGAVMPIVDLEFLDRQYVAVPAILFACIRGELFRLGNLGRTVKGNDPLFLDNGSGYDTVIVTRHFHPMIADAEFSLHITRLVPKTYEEVTRMVQTGRITLGIPIETLIMRTTITRKGKVEPITCTQVIPDEETSQEPDEEVLAERKAREAEQKKRSRAKRKAEKALEKPPEEE
jgi:hypothetical protein